MSEKFEFRDSESVLLARLFGLSLIRLSLFGLDCSELSALSQCLSLDSIKIYSKPSEQKQNVMLNEAHKDQSFR